LADEQLAPAAGPRRYRMSFNCRMTHVGDIIGCLVKEVESPKMEPNGEDFKVSLVCMQDQLPTVLGLVIDNVEHIVIAPHVPEPPKSAPVMFKPQVARPVATPLQREVTYLPAQRTRRSDTSGGVAGTALGKIVLRVFSDGRRVAHPADFAEAIGDAGFSPASASAVVFKLVQEGTLVRVGHGAYRLPTVQDQLSQMEARDPSFSPRKGE